LSRFQSKKEQGIILKDLSEGKIDIIIGTHRLLQKDVCFKRLGFLIIDEEHRFGVKQKEKIKDLKKNIDILMLSATPIPRTLSAALSGFRDLSVIETPPAGRLPIETVISVYDDKVMKDVIKAEISRGGQVFYVYNRIETMFDKADSIKKLLPDIKLGIIHGQMKADDIENIMWKFVNREYDVLLATTIIESGLDIPTVNSMIIEDVQNFGLSQLYQLRGRIGRNTQKAYCYMFYDDKGLTDTAVKRLEALKEFNNLGSGFKLALKDLEIRGAGGILSANQHGFVKDVGYDMFVKMLEEEGGNIKSGISDMNSENRLNEIDVEINLRSNALLPVSYIQDEEIRVLFYRKLAEVHNIDAIDSIKKELTDRFGNLPIEALNLFDITVLKLEAKKLNIEAIRESDSYISVHFYKAEALSHNNLRKLVHIYAKSIEFIVGKNAFKLNKKYLGQFNNIEFVRKMLEIIKSL
jgi:transcription-repair coupling factor (superfamily II helicase)